MVATIMDILSPEERQAQAGMANLNPLTGQPYNRPTGLKGMWDFMKDPLKANTPLGNLATDWRQQDLMAEPQPYGPMEPMDNRPGGSLFSDSKVPEMWDYAKEKGSDFADMLSKLFDARGLAVIPGSPEGQLQAAQPNQPEEPALSGGFQLGGLPKMIDAAKYEGTASPDFSAAVSALGNAPQKPQQRPLGERLGRVLGGAAGGASRAVRGTTGGHSVAQALAGGAAGSGLALGRISREEQVREDRWKQMVQTHKARSSELQAKVASAKTAHAQREAVLDYTAAQEQARVEREYEGQKTMQVHNLGKGIVVYQTYDEKTGKFNMHKVDFLEGWREKDFMLKMALAGKRDEVWIGGKTHIKVGPEMTRAIEQVMIDLHSDENFLQQVYEFMAAEGGVDIEKFMSEVVEGNIDWENAMPMVTFAALRLRGIQTNELEAMMDPGAEKKSPRSKSSSIGPLQILGLSPVGG